MAKIEPGDGDARHGTPNGYSNCGCGCEECTEAHRVAHYSYTHADPARLAAHAERMRMKRAGEPGLAAPPGLLSTAQAARVAGCSSSYLRRQLQAGKITGVTKLPAPLGWFFDEAEVERWMAARRPRRAKVQAGT